MLAPMDSVEYSHLMISVWEVMTYSGVYGFMEIYINCHQYLKFDFVSWYDYGLYVFYVYLFSEVLQPGYFWDPSRSCSMYAPDHQVKCEGVFPYYHGKSVASEGVHQKEWALLCPC